MRAWVAASSRRLLCAGAVVFAAGACACVDMSTVYGIASIPVGAETIYLKREGRGVSYDVVYLSSDKNLRDLPRAGRDFELTHQYYLYYRVEGATLHLYSASPTIPPLAEGSLPVPVELHVLRPLEWAQLEKEHGQRGLARIEVSFDQALRP